MLLSLLTLLGKPGERLPLDYAFDWRELEVGFRKPAAETVFLRGEISNAAGVITLRAVLSTMLHQVCDRCLVRFEQEYSLPLEMVLSESRENEENEDIVLIENKCVALEELARDAFILAMDMKTLCSEDCAGLCSGCGVNLNEASCRCRKEVDPRLKALQDYEF